MKKKWYAPSYFFEAAGGALLLGLSKALGLDLASRFGGWLGGRFGSYIGRGRVAKENLAYTMPELSAQEIEVIVNNMWRNIGRTFFEYAHLKKFSKPKHRWRVEIEFSQKARDALRDHQGRVVFFSGHFTNWELLPLPLNLENIMAAAIYQKMSNHYVDFWLSRLRRKAILPYQVSKGSSVRDIIHHIRSNHAFAVLVDQKMLDGIVVRFFGKRAITSEFPATLALKYNYALVPAYIIRADRGWRTRFRLIVCDPLEIDRATQNIRRITRQVNDTLEQIIRVRPDHWLWLHHRWPLP